MLDLTLSTNFLPSFIGALQMHRIAAYVNRVVDVVQDVRAIAHDAVRDATSMVGDIISHEKATGEGKTDNSMQSTTLGQLVSSPSEIATAISRFDPTADNFDSEANSRLFGLLIGINTYHKRSWESGMNNFRGPGFRDPSENSHETAPWFPNLRGAVADAKSFHDYLTSIGVPEKNITLLCEEQATRAKIINAFKILGDENNEIRPGDSIVIFYAGHGAQARPPQRLLDIAECPEHIELLVPHDYNKDYSNHEYMGIPDYTLAALLNTIAKNKGNNITVIFDCCHSASALRGTSFDDLIPRAGPTLTYNLPNDLDEDIWGREERGLAALPRLKHLGAESYVFFSACASFETAQEKGGRGRFTSAFLALLQALGPHTISTLPCSQIVLRLEKIEGQNPQCEGLHIGRPIFRGSSSSRQKIFFNVRSEDPSSQALEFVLDAGSVNGFKQGDEFTVYKTQSDVDQNDPIGHLIIEKIGSHQSTLGVLDGAPPFNLLPAPALRTKRVKHHLELFIDPRDANLRNRINKLDLNTIVITPDLGSSYISLSRDRRAPNQLRFKVEDINLVREGFNCSHYLEDSDQADSDLARILTDLSHYYWHLKHYSPGSLSELPVKISFYELQETDTDPQFIPRISAIDLYNPKTRTITVEVDVTPKANDEVEPKLYGLKVTNQSQERDLFPALFYFDNTDFTISPIYRSPLAVGNSNPEPPLKMGKSITIGYGVGAGATAKPFTFFLAKNQTVDIGFFKLILSTEPVDLQSMELKDPVFDNDGTRGMKQSAGRAGSRKPPPSTWTAITIKVIVRRSRFSLLPRRRTY